MQVVQIQHYLKRARDFLGAMTRLQLDEEHQYSSALLAIHGAISYSDALRSGLGEMNLSAEDHQRAAAKLRKLLVAHKEVNQDGVVHLERLLGRKNLIAYMPASAGINEFKSIHLHAERFAQWAERTANTLKIEGWRNGESN